jgi:uncharacterized protein YcaQ
MRHTSIGWAQVHAFRLRRHHFTDTANLTTICRDVCGIQAQAMFAARIALWSRAHDLTNGDIDTAIWKKRSLVRTSVMRQTLHLLTAADFPIYIAALRRSRVAAIWRLMSKFDIALHEVDALNQATLDALADGPLTQQALKQRVAPSLGKNMRAWMDRIWSIFRMAVVEGLICYGPSSGSQGAFVRTDQWLPKQRKISERDAQHAMLRGFLRAYGPATLRDFAKWTGFGMPDAKAVWTRHWDEMLEVDVDGHRASILRNDLRVLRESSLREPIVRLAPSFDPYMLAHSSKDHYLEPAHYKKVYKSAGWLAPVVLVDGRVAGIWSSERVNKCLLIDIDPFEKMPKKIRSAIEHEAEQLGVFLELPAEIKFRS